MSEKYHIDINGNPAKCAAKKRECPRGGSESHYSSQEEALEAIAKEQGSSIPKLQTKPKKPKMLQESIDKYEAYKKQWNDRWDETYKRFNRDRELPSEKQRRFEEIRKNQAPGDTSDGAWYEGNPDGSVNIPAGTYYYVSLDGWRADDLDNPDNDAELSKRLDKWSDQAYAGTPPGTANGAYFNGKPSFIFTSIGMGHNHGYDGEILMHEDLFNEMKKKNAIGGLDLYGAPRVTVEKETQVYGFLGDPSKVPPVIYDYDDKGEELTPEVEECLDNDEHPSKACFYAREIVSGNSTTLSQYKALHYY